MTAYYNFFLRPISELFFLMHLKWPALGNSYEYVEKT